MIARRSDDLPDLTDEEIESRRRRRHRKVAVRRWVIIVGVVALIMAFGWVGWTTYENHVAAQETLDYAQQVVALEHRSHQLEEELVKSTNEHTSTLAEIKHLTQQVDVLAFAVANVDLKLPAADAYLGALAQNLLANVQSLCNATHASCGTFRPPVSRPALATPTTTATTTTTTPRHPKHP